MSRKSLIIGMALIVFLFSGGFVLADFSAGDGVQAFNNDDLVAGVGEGEPDSAIKTYPACWDSLTQCHGDSDESGDVKGSDFLALKSSWYECYGDPNYNPCADFDRDSCVSGADFLTLKSNWYKNVPADCIPGDPYRIYLVLVQIPAGEFEMGDHFNDGWPAELPVHTVTVDSFYMSSTEVTNGQYCDFLNSAYGQGLITVTGGVVYKAGSGTSYPYCDTSAASGYNWSQIDYSGGVFSVKTKGGRNMSNDPVVEVSWYGAKAFCDYYGYRLPTEAEWEYAARGGLAGKRFPWGDTISHSQANYHSRSSYSYDISPTRGHHPTYKDGIRPYTAPVGSFSPNGYGLYDMSGNVYEWCNDWYSSSYYSSSPPNNPMGPTSGTCRVLRGGSWCDYAFYCRVASRYFYYPGFRTYHRGFRVALSDQPDPCGMEWVYIKDPGFNGQMSKYETTNAQYCQFLNAALASGDIIIDGNYVNGANGSNTGADFTGQRYYYLAGSGWTGNGATNGGAARINYSGGVFSVDNGFENHPVTYVSWYGATAFCNYYGYRYGYRLPTEWEWQAVADYDGSYIYGCGTSINNSIANYWDSIHPHGTTVVGAFGTYGYGMCDMAGNAMEWTSSFAFESYHFVCGGSWYCYDYHCDVSVFCIPYDSFSSVLGFRVCR